MSQMQPCPHCGADIESDSWYCDQCANELMKCPQCGRFCKGKFCARCGVPTVKASAAASQQQPQQQPQQPQQQQQPQQPTYQQPTYQQPAARPTTNPQQPMPGTGTSIPGMGGPAPQALVCRAMNVRLPLMSGAVIGRVNGQYAAQMGAFQYVSGTHARIDFDGAGWTITDLGSRNGTAVNGLRCTPSQPFRMGDTIRFSNFYDFTVE